MHDMRYRIVSGVFFAHDQDRIRVGDRVGERQVVGEENGFIEIETDNVVLIGQCREIHFVGVRFDDNVHRSLQILLQLLEHVILKTNDGTLIDEIVGGMIKKAHRQGVAVYHVFFFQFRDMQLGQNPAARKDGP